MVQVLKGTFASLKSRERSRLVKPEVLAEAEAPKGKAKLGLLMQFEQMLAHQAEVTIRGLR